jgi:hypothetical protein
MADAVSLAGWRWLRCYDAGLGDYACDLCGAEIGGILHHVRHDDYPDGLLVGPKCGRIVLGTEDADLAEASERVAQERASRRRLVRNEHIKKLAWSFTLNGHETAKLGSTRVVISQSASRAWAIALIQEPSGTLTIPRETYDAREDAMTAGAILLVDKWMSHEYGDQGGAVASLRTKMSHLEHTPSADRGVDATGWA